MFFNNNDLDETAHYYIWLHIVTISLVLIGALNWGSIGLFSYNFVNKLFKSYLELKNEIDNEHHKPNNSIASNFESRRQNKTKL